MYLRGGLGVESRNKQVKFGLSLLFTSSHSEIHEDKVKVCCSAFIFLHFDCIINTFCFVTSFCCLQPWKAKLTTVVQRLDLQPFLLHGLGTLWSQHHGNCVEKWQCLQLSDTGDHSSYKAVSGTDWSASIYFNNLDDHFRVASVPDQAILKFILKLTLTGECCHDPCLDLVRLSWWRPTKLIN